MTQSTLPVVLTGSSARFPVTSELYHHIVVRDGRVNEYDRLLPIEKMRRAETELVAGLVPAKPVNIAELAALLVASYPSRNLVDPHIFLKTMASDLAPFPLDILVAACDDVRRNLTFFPTIADVYTRAHKLRGDRERLLAIVRAQLKEHERRSAEAASAARRDRKQEAENRKEVAAAARRAVGATAPTPEMTSEEAEADLQRRKAAMQEQMRAAGMTVDDQLTVQVPTSPQIEEHF